ncbi:MAG: type II secretion system F family protein [Candidatus Eisenbacteria bacterium]|uniref:Type II secretion system F family protein n=1 Tax=Eiseniibacteriota bacterium TaxID=2212470 RepID=A0A9D6L3A8_UNCEI|nr:type II secretion system F family protein [Candidatus Eisenbacteria bacterium]MBI3538992.1 type II secretion system F family protein [Candidatus Eisenbacteria bacterium]
MPSYFYKARDASGRAHEGIEIAASEEEVLRILENSKLIPVFIENRAPGGAAAVRGQLARRYYEIVQRWRTSVPPVSVALFARQLSTMISAGLPLVRSLRSIARDHEDKKLGVILERVSDDVQKGESLSTALGKHTGAFDEVFVSLVNTGEISGTLDRIMDQTATYLEKAEALRLKVQAALRYPIFVLSFAVLILVAMIVKIIPMFSAIYERFRVPLPLPTQILLGVSRVVVGNLLLAGGLTVIAAIAAAYFAQTERGRLWIDRTKFNLPIFGPLIRMYAVTKFARTLGMLTASGTQILYALKVMRPVPGNRVLEQGIEHVRSRVEEGDSLSKAMTEAQVFPEMLVQMTATGEETGQLDNMLTRTADFYEQRVTAQVDGLSSLVEPIAIVVLGGLVGVMLLALYLPIFNLGQAMRQGLLGH